MQAPSTGPKPGQSNVGVAVFERWFSAGRFAAILGLLIFTAFPHIILGWQTFVARDYGFFVHPLAFFQRECFWQGELPHWNPYNDCGLPFLAQWNTMPLYPPVLFYLLLPLTWALGVFSLLHQWWAGFGMYWLVRRWTGSNFAAAFAGLAFAFNGLTLNLIMWPSHIATFSWMPWVILLVERAWSEGGRRIPLAVLAGAMQMLAGGPETILFTWLLLSLLWLGQCVKGGVPRLPMFGRFVLVVVLVAGVAAAQLLPFLDLAAHSQREAGYADSRWAMPSWGWANFLVPMVFGHIWNSGVFFQYDQFWTSSYYLGMGVTLLGLFAVLSARDWRLRLMCGGAAVALLFAFGDQTPVVRVLRQWFPQLAIVTYPVKYVLVVAFVGPLAAGFGLDHLLKARVAARLKILGAILLLLIAAILFWAWRWPFATDNVRDTIVNGLTRAGFLLIVLLVLLALLKAGTRSWWKWLPPGLLLLAWLDVMTHEPNQNPAVNPSVFEPGPERTGLVMNPQPELGGSRAMVSPFAEREFTRLVMHSPADNFLVKRIGYFANCNLLDHVPKVNGFFSLYPRECGEMASLFYESQTADFPGLKDFLGVSQITAPGEYVRWQARATFHPLVTVGQRVVFAEDRDVLWAITRPDFDSTEVVYLPTNAAAKVSATSRVNARVLDSHFARDRVEAEVEAEEPTMAVVAQSYYHQWRAFVDDEPTALWRANYAYQAVQIPAGRHTIRLVYEDRALVHGAMLSITSLLACGVLSVRRSPGKV